MQVAVLGQRSYLIDQVAIRLPIDHIRYLTSPAQLSNNDDIAFCLSVYKLLKPEHFTKPKMGTFVLHSTDLPKGRGWAPVNWALINGDNKICLTSFQMDKGCDTGPYYMKTEIGIDITDTIYSAYKKVESHMVYHMRSILEELMQTGQIKLHKQQGKPTWNPRRTAADAELDPNKSLIKNWFLLRACDNDEYPAFFKLNGKYVYLRYEVLDE